MGGLNAQGAVVVGGGPQPAVHTQGGQSDRNSPAISTAMNPGAAHDSAYSDGSLRPKDINMLRLLYEHGPQLDGEWQRLHEAARDERGARFPLGFDVPPALLNLQLIVRVVRTREEQLSRPGSVLVPNIQADWYLSAAGYSQCERYFPDVTPWKPTRQPRMGTGPVGAMPAKMIADENDD